MAAKGNKTFLVGASNDSAAGWNWWKIQGDEVEVEPHPLVASESVALVKVGGEVVARIHGPRIAWIENDQHLTDPQPQPDRSRH